MKFSRASLLAWLVLAGPAISTGPALADPLTQAAQPSALAAQRLINGVAYAGAHRLVAVGQRGHILWSDDAGQHWTQAQVPVSSDLTALQFVDASHGFAVGHDGVVLGSRDGGMSWQLLLDGRRLNALVLEQLQALDASRPELLAEARRNVEAGPDKPLLGLWFSNAQEGFVVGAYNLILRTADGGKSWQSWFDRTDNPRLLNLYAIGSQGDTLFIAGESGLLLRLAPQTQRFEALASPYKGSFFGLQSTPAGLLAYGMRGHAFLNPDAGRSWQALNTGLAASITAAALGKDGQILLIDQGGRIAQSRDGAASFQRLNPQPSTPAAALALVPGGLVVGGPRGLRVVTP
ncbi:MAG TPA: YCF48-related protein [Burkholderiaceae bacterium]